MQARCARKKAHGLVRELEASFVLAGEASDGREVRCRPTLEARIADGATLRDRLLEHAPRLLEREVREDVAEVHLRIGDRLLGACGLTRLEVLADEPLRAGEVTELRVA